MSKAIEILNSYDVIFSDMDGVLHDRINILPNVQKTFKFLIDARKKVILVTNSTRTSTEIHKILSKMGLGFLDSIVSAGDFFRSQYAGKFLNIYSEPGYIIGHEKLEHLLDGLDFNETKDINKAKYLLLVHEVKTLEEIYAFDLIYKTAIKNQLMAVCLNTDKVTYFANQAAYPSGKFGERYEEVGGKVYYYGKPGIEIFEYAKSKFQVDDINAIMLGDNLLTDIKGAYNLGIDSMLLLTGVTKEADAAKSKIKPTYILKNL